MLKFRANAGQAPPLKSFTLKLNKGLGFSAKNVKMKNGISVTGCSLLSAKVESGVLHVSFGGTSSTSCSVTLEKPALTETKALQFKKAKGPNLVFNFPMTFTDVLGNTTQVTLTVL
jgi:uncharacterized protein (DUF169 family)